MHKLFGHEDASVLNAVTIAMTRALVLVKSEKGEEGFKAQCVKILSPRLSSSGEESEIDGIRMALTLKQIFLVDTSNILIIPPFFVTSYMYHPSTCAQNILTFLSTE
jgi:hypothetical protein